MGFWDINYNAKAWQSLPERLRKPVQYAWVRAMISPVVTMAAWFKTYREASLYDLSITGQVCKLEKALNDAFDDDLRRIYIENPAYYDPIFVYLDVEDKPVYVALDSELPVDPADYAAPVYAFQDDEVYSGTGLQFKVRVPGAITLDAETLGHMQAILNRYRLVSKKNYTITSF